MKKKYLISNKGNLWSFFLKGKKKLSLDGEDNYYVTTLSISRHKSKKVQIHRLVAEMFIDNPDNKPWINHKDRNRKNNNITNLEWVTPLENNLHSFATSARNNGARAIFNVDDEGEIVQMFPSISMAIESLTTDDKKAWVSVLKKGLLDNTKKVYGFYWYYAVETEEFFDIEDMKIIPGFSRYLISDDGNVYSIYYRKLMTQSGKKYKSVGLVDDNDKNKKMRVHRLVALTYIREKEGCNIVNHKDGNGLDNHHTNL